MTQTRDEGIEARRHAEADSTPACLHAFVPVSLSWAVFLGVSWTWCIGMYLPVLLVRDMGFWGWVIFAVPNVVGAAAMGWVLQDSAASRRCVEAHRPACIAFSVITIAFHLFFVGWMVRLLIGTSGVAMVIAASLIWVIMRIHRDGARWCAGAVWLASLLLGLWWLGRGHLTLPSPSMPAGSMLELGALAPVCLLGFVLCPYLDLTFHRARQATSPAGGRWAFGVGFGVVFLSMILLSLGYALPLDHGVDSALMIGVGIHMTIQSAFTVAAHLREMIPSPMPSHRIASLVWLGIAGVAALAAIPGGELTYRLFMGFYGLVFPAYVWIFMGRPTRGPSAAAFSWRSRQAAIYAIVLILAGPMFAAGFLGGQWIWLWPATAIFLLGRIAGRPSKVL